MNDCSQGTDSEKLAMLQNIDYITLHFYPENWKMSDKAAYEFIKKSEGFA